MSKITDQLIRHLARLSRIDISKAEAKALKQDLESVINYVDKLKNVNTKGLKPTHQVSGLQNVYRGDKPAKKGLSPQELFANAPASKDGHLKVKRIL